MSEYIIQLVDVVKTFSNSLGKTQRVLDGVNLGIKAGRTTVIAGGSGQGKSVTIKLILGLMRPDSGRILVEGEDVAAMNQKELKRVRTSFGVLFQGGALFDSLNVYENVAMPLEERTRLNRKDIHERVSKTLGQFDLTGHEDKYPAQLSGGMQKRVGLARALQMKPRIMLFDEPTTGLDPARSQEIYRLFYNTQQEYGYTSVIVSHDIPKVFNLADQVVIIHNGKAKVFDSFEEIQWSNDPMVRSFVEMTMGNIYQSQLEDEE